MKSKTAPDRTGYDMRRFYTSLNVTALWEDFFLSVAPDGSPRAKTLARFLKLQGYNKKQIQFLQWAWGPPEPTPAMTQLYSQMERQYGELVSPQDWENKRETGGWFTQESLRVYSRSIRSKIDALEALRTVGNDVTVNSVIRFEKLAQQLDREFSGKFFEANLTLKENMERASAYLALHARIQSMQYQAQNAYALSHGINYNDMSGFERLLAGRLLMMREQQGELAEKSGTHKIIEAMVGMTLEKGAKYNTPVPEDMKRTALAVVEKKDPPRKPN